MSKIDFSKDVTELLRPVIAELIAPIQIERLSDTGRYSYGLVTDKPIEDVKAIENRLKEIYDEPAFTIWEMKIEGGCYYIVDPILSPLD